MFHLKRKIAKMMNRIEDINDKMLHEIDPDLEKKCFDAMDSNNICKMNQIIKKLDEMT